MSPLLVTLLVCFTMYACNARCLGFNNKETRKPEFSKDADKVSLLEISISSEMISSSEAQEREEVGNIDKRRSASTMKLKEGCIKKNPSGNDLIVSSQDDLQQKAKAEGLKRQERSVLGSEPSDTKEAVDSNENGIVEDSVVMDYAQPHRKPPIHNEKP